MKNTLGRRIYGNSALAPPFETGQNVKRFAPPAEEPTPPETEGGTWIGPWALGLTNVAGWTILL